MRRLVQLFASFALVGALFVGTVGIVAIWAATCALATQHDPELDDLFKRLQSTHDENEAALIQLQIWDRWLATDDKTAARMMSVGIQAMNENRLGDAQSTFDALVEEQPDFAEAWNKRATVEYMSGDYAASVADIEHTLALEPRHFGALSGLGLIYVELDNLPAALRAFEAALKVNPHLPQVRENVEALRKRLKGQGT